MPRENTIKIKNKKIGKNHPVFIIAEAGVNHNGNIRIAKKLVDIAKESGVDAVKFQTFIVDEGTPRYLQKVSYQRQNTHSSESMYDMLKRFEFGYKEFREIKDYCDAVGIIFLSTPCDLKSAGILKDLDTAAYKVGSGDLTFIPLLKQLARDDKPLILSTGMNDISEIKEAVKAIEKEGNTKIIILHCTSNYPLEFRNANLNVLTLFRKIFEYPIGYSDHTIGIEASIAAVALGARVVEKHITLDRKMKGPDHSASLEPQELGQLVRSVRNVELAMGAPQKKINRSEKEIAKRVKKSIVATCAIKKGEILSRQNTGIMKPGEGLKPKYWEQVIGRVIKCDKSPCEYILWKDLK